MKKNICFLCILIVIALLLPGCSAGKTVMKIGKLNVSYDMLRYFTKNYMNGYDGVSEESFRTDDELRKKLDDNVLSSLRELAAYVTLADKYGVKLDRDDKSTVDGKIADMKAEYSDTKAYKKGLEEAYATEAVIRRIYEIQLLCDKLYDRLTDGSDDAFRSDNETIEKDIADGNWFSAEYILITYSSEDKESRREYAEKMLEGMDKNKSLRDLYDKNSTVYGLGISYARIDAFIYTQQKEYFEKAVCALEVGQTSGVTDTVDGFLIVRRLELSQAYIEDKFISVFCVGYLEREFFNLVEKTAGELEISCSKGYENINFCDIE